MGDFVLNSIVHDINLKNKFPVHQSLLFDTVHSFLNYDGVFTIKRLLANSENNFDVNEVKKNYLFTPYLLKVISLKFFSFSHNC